MPIDVDQRNMLRLGLLQNLLDSQENTDELIRILVQKHKRFDILYNYVLGDGMDHYHLYPPHAKIRKFQEENEDGLILAHRGLGKTTTGTKGYVVHKAICYPNETSLVISSNDPQSKKISAGVRYQFENNKDLVRIFGDLRDPDRWTKSEMNMVHRDALWDEATITFAGLGSAVVVGMHVHNLIFDDIVGTRNATGQHREVMIDNVFNQALPTLLNGGRIYFIGTRYAPNDLYGYLL